MVGRGRVGGIGAFRVTTVPTIAYKQKLVRVLEKDLQTAFNPHLTLIKPTLGRKRTVELRVFIENWDREVEDDGGNVHYTKAILGADSLESDFYVSFLCIFRHHVEGVCLQHVSLSIFYDLIAEELVPVFRAEWDALAASDAGSRHAQPHWHFVQSPSRIERIVKNFSTARMEFSAPEDCGLFQEVIDLGRFHFAMASLWPKRGHSHKEVFSADDFTAWFASLVEYVANQIDYIRSKSTRAAGVNFTSARTENS